MAKKKTKEPKPVKVNLGGGQWREEGWINLDICDLPEVDIVHDLTKFPWPFEDESVDEIKSQHLIEHFDGPTFIKFMEECYRILKPAWFSPDNPNQPIKGFMTHLAPYYTSIRCWQDPTHKQAISEAKFLYFNKQWREQNKLDHYDITCDFDFYYQYNVEPNWSQRSQEALQFAIKHYNNVVNDIIVTLTKRIPDKKS